MRNLLLALTALTGVSATVVTAADAAAATLAAGACVPGVFATPCAPALITSGPTPLLTLPATNVGAFSISGSAIAGVSATGATFNSQTIQVSSTGAGGLIDIYFTAYGIATAGQPLGFTSTFTSNQQNAVTHSVIESTWLDNTNTPFGLGTQLASATLNNPVLQTAGPVNTVQTPAALVSVTELYQIRLEGCATQPNGICTANLTIDLAASQVPEPASMALLGLGLLGLCVTRRRPR